MKPVTTGKYTEDDCHRIGCQNLQYIEEQDGLYQICTRQGTLCAPFCCKLLDSLGGTRP